MSALLPLEAYHALPLPELKSALEQIPLDAPDFDARLEAIDEVIHSAKQFLEDIRQKRTASNDTASRPFRLLIAGSRDATAEMLDKARQAVKRAKANGWAVLVGDAVGVDTAVINACNELEVDYVCFGLTERPRTSTFASLQAGGKGRYYQVQTGTFTDFPARDRKMIDAADRGLFIWNGESKETKAGYIYMQSLNKPADLLTFSEPAQQTKTESPARSTSNSQPSTLPAIIELLVDASPSDGTMQGIYGIRALDANGNLLRQLRHEEQLLDEKMPDYAKLKLIISALDRLAQNLKHDTASYTLRIAQSSKNVEGWLGKGFKRNAPTVKTLATAVDKLLARFPQREWVKMPRAQLTSALAKVK